MSHANHSALIALGSNDNSVLGDQTETVAKAVNLLKNLATSSIEVSRFYRTPAFPEGSGPEYVNAVVRIWTQLDPAKLLQELHKIEEQADRTRDIRWGQRTLDLDLIAHGDVVLPDIGTHNRWRALPLDAQMTTTPETLILPHPRVQDRAFVLVPLCDVVPDWIHPLIGLTAAQMRDALPADQIAQVVPLDG